MVRVLVAVVLLTTPTLHALEMDWDAIGAEATAMLRQYVQVDTTNPPGNEIAGARFLAERFGKDGIETRIFESEPGRATILARLPGTGDDRPVILLNHLDVVSANEKEWSHPPFGRDIDGGFLYGRGAIDCKGMAVVEAMAMLAIARSGEKLSRDVIFLGTADEEKGGALGAGWFVDNHFDLIEDAEFVFNEGGHGRKLDDGTTVFEVSAVEKTPFWLRLTASGQPGHGSTPRGMSAVDRLVRALDRVRRRPRELRVTSEVDAYYKALAKRQSGDLREKYASLEEALAEDDFRSTFLARPEDAALVQSTVSITVLDGSSKTNVVPPQASAELDCRLLPDETPAVFLKKVRDVIDDDGIEIETLLNFPPSASPIDTPLYRAIETVAAAEGATVVPNVLRGFTDAHYFREKGMTVYGFVPVVLSDEDAGRMHGVDERLPIAELAAGTRRLVEILRELAAPTAAP